MNKLSRKKVEEMLPDYVSDTLNAKDKENFEYSISDFQDLLDELNSVKETFKKFEEFDLKKSIKLESKNVSVKVQEKISDKQIKSPFLTYLPKYVYPSMGLLVIVYFLFFTDDFNIKKQNEQFTIFEKDEVLLDLDNISEFDVFSNSSNIAEDKLFSDEEFANFNIYSNINYTELENELIFNKVEIDDLIKSLNEDELINILEELKDENIGV